MAQAVLVRRTGDPAVLRLEDHELEAPGSGEVRIRIAAAGVNYIDVYFRTGLYPCALPYVAGLEGAGIVEALGSDVEWLAVGDHVAWSAVPGSYAAHINAPERGVVRVPPGIPDEIAAAAMLQGMTAHYLTHSTRKTRPGDTALVHAAAGGVGLLLIQMLKAAGAHVIGTCSTAEKEKLACEAGADHVIRYNERNFAEEVRRLSRGRGVDVVYDSVGLATFEDSLKCLRPRGLLALFGQSSGVVPPFDLGRLNAMGSLFVTRPSLGHYTQERAELEERASAVLGAIAEDHLKVRVGVRFPLAEAGRAHQALEGRRTTGKVLLIPG
jgi:NADPH2:quinone reductase